MLEPSRDAARQADRFDNLFLQFYPGLVPLAERVLGDRAEAEDVVQEAFLRLARLGHLGRADGDRPAVADSRTTTAESPDAESPDHDSLLTRPTEVVGAWLRRVTLNLAVNRLRDRRRAADRHERVGRADPSFHPAIGRIDDAGPASVVTQSETRAEVRAALASLPERQRDCLLLRHSGYSYAEIAATLGIATGSVGVLLMRAERAFRAAYRSVDPMTGPDSAAGSPS